jgi:HEAT repeat protein
LLVHEEGARHDLLRAVETIGGARASVALARLAREEFLDFGIDAVRSLGRLGEAALLLDLARDSLPLSLRLHAIRAAGAVQAPEAGPPLAAIARHDPDAKVRLTAMEAYVSNGYLAQESRPLVDLLADPYLRLRALDLLGEAPPAEAVSPLIETLARADEPLRLRVIDLLGRTDGEVGFLPLVRELEESSARVRAAVVNALRARGDDRALAAIAAILEPDHPLARVAAAAFLGAESVARREDPACLALALQESLGLDSSDLNGGVVRRVRRQLLRARFTQDWSGFDRSLPPRLRKLAGASAAVAPVTE